MKFLHNNNTTPSLFIPLALLAAMAMAAAGCATSPETPSQPAEDRATAAEKDTRLQDTSAQAEDATPPAAAATAQASPAPATQETGPETAQAPPQSPAPAQGYTPSQVAALLRDMINHRRTMFSSSRGEYLYYIGGTLTATFKTDSRQFRLTPENGPEETACVYGEDGTQADGKTRQDVCDGLLDALKASLAAP